MIAETRSPHEQLLRLLPEPMGLVDRSATLVDVNPAFAEILGRNPESLLGAPISDVVVDPDPELMNELDRWRSSERLESTMLTLRTLVGPVTHRVSGGALGDGLVLIRVERRTSVALDEAGREGGPSANLRTLQAELDTARAAEAELRRLIQQDRLTGLPNRDRLADQLARALGEGKGGAVLFVDLDHFKAINDVFGHDAGDAALREVARRISGAVRPSDLVARYAGDEFAVLLVEVALDEAVTVARRVGAALRRNYEIGGDHADLCASIGVAGIEAHSSVEAILSRADAAMYAAKGSGGDRVVVDTDHDAAA